MAGGLFAYSVLVIVLYGCITCIWMSNDMGICISHKNSSLLSVLLLKFLKPRRGVL